MSGYTRQSAASIITTATITASPLNAEFNALAAAFNATGHTHSGSTGDGPKLPITSMADIADMKVMGNVSGSLGAVGLVSILDEDDMASDSATSLVTQQSVKAFSNLKLSLTGGTMSGNIDAGTNTVTNLGTPSASTDAANKAYVDNTVPAAGVYASAASDSADAALVSETNSSNSETAAGISETNSSNNNTYASEWAVKVEDSAVSIAAGGDGSSTFSALHWAAKAAASAGSIVIADQATAEAGTNNTEYMTPLRVAQSITENATTPLTTLVQEAKDELRLYQHFMMGS